MAKQKARKSTKKVVPPVDKKTPRKKPQRAKPGTAKKPRKPKTGTGIKRKNEALRLAEVSKSVGQSKAMRMKLFLKHLDNNAGLVYPTCQQTKISPRTFYHWKKTSTQFAESVEHIQEKVLDWAEGKLLENIKEGHYPSLSKFLDAKGKKRGYGFRPGMEDDNKDPGGIKWEEVKTYEPSPQIEDAEIVDDKADPQTD